MQTVVPGFCRASTSHHHSWQTDVGGRDKTGHDGKNAVQFRINFRKTRASDMPHRCTGR